MSEIASAFGGKPFKLGAAKRGEPIQLRFGASAQFVGTYINTYGQEIVVAYVPRLASIHLFNADGGDCGGNSKQDLLMASSRVQLWARAHLSRDRLPTLLVARCRAGDSPSWPSEHKWLSLDVLVHEYDEDNPGREEE